MKTYKRIASELLLVQEAKRVPLLQAWGFSYHEQLIILELIP